MKEEANVISAFSQLKSKVNAVTKRGLELPLPMPFELPRNYPAIVMVGLEKDKLCGKARSSNIASAIFKYKNYPDMNEYNHIGELIVKKYPFLKYHSIIMYVQAVSFPWVPH